MKKRSPLRTFIMSLIGLTIGTALVLTFDFVYIRTAQLPNLKDQCFLVIKDTLYTRNISPLIGRAFQVDLKNFQFGYGVTLDDGSLVYFSKSFMNKEFVERIDCEIYWNQLMNNSILRKK